MAGVRARYGIVASLAILVLAAVVLPPLIGLNRFERRISDSIGQAIGRPVRMSSAKISLLPRPGFEISDFVVEEDPAFGVEPILRCEQVTAYVRLLPLWRGHLEIARISFDEPSVNLVRNREGRWNFDSVLSQAAQVKSAPTGEHHIRGVPRFPYISASDARVNFKYDDEKMPFSFLNADLAVWLQSPNEWRVKFAAQPVRTDLSLDLANTGTLRVEGSLRRGPTIRQMPIDLRAEWSNAPLGQLSRIFSGTDAGWRGDLDVAASVVGSADQADLKILAQARGIHRVEFEPREPMNLDATCQARFTRVGRSFDGVTCLAPVGPGHLLLTGSIHDVVQDTDPALSLEINNVPVAAAIDGLRLMRPGFASEVRATGAINGNFSYERAKPVTSALNGQATMNGVTIAAPGLSNPLVLPVLRLTTETKPAPHSVRAAGRSRLTPANLGPLIHLDPFVIIPPSSLPATLSDSLTMNGSFSQSGFNLHLAGESHVQSVLSLGGQFGFMRSGSVTFGPQGIADVDLTVRGPWLRPVSDPEHPTAPVILDGSLRVRNAQLSGDFLAQPLQIAAAQATFANGRVEWIATSMNYGPIHGDGSLSFPVFCLQSLPCERNFTLHVATLDAATAQNALLGATRHGELVQELLDRIGPSAHPWPALDGAVQVGDLTLRGVGIRDVAASLNIDRDGVQIKSFSGRTLDGSLQLSGTMKTFDGNPRYDLDVHLDHAAVPAVAGVFQEVWGPGTINVDATVQLSGFNTQQLASSATGKFRWNWTKGGLAAGGLAATQSPTPPVDGDKSTAPALASPLASTLNHFDGWTAEGTIGKNALTVEKSLLTQGDSVTSLAGTIGFDRTLSLTASGAPSAGKVLGTLQHPAIGAPDVAVAKAAKP